MPATKKAIKTKNHSHKTAAPVKVRKGPLGKAPSGPTVYTCTVCGKVTGDRGHLCTPKATTEVYMCAYCGAATGDPRHVCSPMLAVMKYTCKSCGRVTPFRGAVCEPKEIA